MFNESEIVDLVYNFLVALTTYEYTATWCLATYIFSLVYFSANYRELRFYVTNDSTHDSACVNADLDTSFTAILQGYLRNEGLCFYSELNDSNGMIARQEAWV